MPVRRRRATSRPVLEIIRANTLTRFNALLGVLLVLILVVGPIQDAIFGLVLLGNTAIGVVQELRVKWALDRLSLLTAARARVRRDGVTSEVAAEEIAVGDLVELASGEQVLVDGEVVESAGLELNEALVTGEAAAVAKLVGGTLLSGSFAVAGTGAYRATHVGGDSYAETLVDQARHFRPARSQLRDGINRMLAMIAVVFVPVGALLIRSQALSNPNLADAIRATVAGLVTMVPEGLVLLTSLALAVAVLRLARRGTLVQELASVEALARADLVFVDKTGTITDGSLALVEVEVVDGDRGEVESVLAAMAATGDDPDLRAIAAGVAAPPAPVEHRVPFSAERRWSGVTLATGAEWRLGAPEELLGEGAAQDSARRLAAEGMRVLAVRGPGSEALVTLREQVRPGARETFAYLAGQGVAVKLLSGDNPATVAGVARRAGLEPGFTIDARELDPAGRDLVQRLSQSAIVGRAGPEAKRDIVARMRHAGFVVAMVGDGVNDVLAIKEADVGIAMLSASAACRSVAQLVVTRGGFDILPTVIAEGRRVIANVERLASLFLTKTAYAVAIAFTAGILLDPFPFLPRHLTLIGGFTIGLPAFILALERNEARPARHFVARTLRFAIPAGLLAATATYLAYQLASEQASLDVARTMAALVLSGIALWVLAILTRPITPRRAVVVGAMVLCVVLTFLLPQPRGFFGLTPPSAVLWLAGIGIVALSGTVLEAAAWTSGLIASVRGRAQA